MPRNYEAFALKRSRRTQKGKAKNISTERKIELNQFFEQYKPNWKGCIRNRQSLGDREVEVRRKEKELEESVKREQFSIQVDEVQLIKDQGQFEVYQRLIQKEQEKESVDRNLMESKNELNRKRSSLFEINQQLKSEHGKKKNELDKYLSTLKLWRYWVYVEAREKQVFDNLENNAMLKEETASEDE